MWRTAHSFWMLQDMQHFQHGLCNKLLQLQNAVYCSYFCLKTAGETQGEALLLLITLGSLPVTVLNRWSTKRGASARFWSCSIYCVTSWSSHRTFTVKLMSYRWGVFASMIITLASLSLSQCQRVEQLHPVISERYQLSPNAVWLTRRCVLSFHLLFCLFVAVSTELYSATVCHFTLKYQRQKMSGDAV